MCLNRQSGSNRRKSAPTAPWYDARAPLSNCHVTLSASTQNPKDQAAQIKCVRAVEDGLGGQLAPRLVEDFGWTEQQIEAWQRDRQEGPESIVEIDRLPTEAFKAPSEATITNDREIVVDGLVAGAIYGIGKRVAALRGKLGIGDTIDKGPIEWRGD